MADTFRALPLRRGDQVFFLLAANTWNLLFGRSVETNPGGRYVTVAA
jgi:hypothetical protein